MAGQDGIHLHLRNFEELRKQIRTSHLRAASVLNEPLISGVRTACVTLAKFTYPKDQFRMASRIRGDVFNLFDPGHLFAFIRSRNGLREAKIFWAIYKRGNDAKTRKYLKSLKLAVDVRRTVPEAEYNKARDRYGQVQVSRQHTIVTNEAKLEAFFKKRVKTIGAAAAGWIAAGNSVTTGRFTARGVPRWKKTGQHKKSRGDVDFDFVNGVRMRARIFNRVDYVERVCPEYLQRKAVDIATAKMEKALKIALRHEAKFILQGETVGRARVIKGKGSRVR